MSISKIAMLTFGMAILTSSAFLAQQAFGVATQCDECPNQLAFCLGQAGSDQGAIDQCNTDFDMCELNFCRVGGLPLPLNESEVFGELAQQYSLWLIPAISAIGIATYLVKRKF